MNKTRMWILGAAIVIIIGGGWLAMSHQGAAPAPSAQAQQAAPSAGDYHDNIYLTKTGADGSAYMTDFDGMTLYTSDNDIPGVSNCSGACAKTWRPYTSGATAQGQLPSGITVVTRDDGSTQFAWDGKPLYYYSKDANPGDTFGVTADAAWHVIKM
jgi:predicted lipoprotein with Yx(FWY)xxD motif